MKDKFQKIKEFIINYWYALLFLIKFLFGIILLLAPIWTTMLTAILLNNPWYLFGFLSLFIIWPILFVLEEKYDFFL